MTPMTLLLALKNTRLYFHKRLPLALFLAATMALLFIGNTVFSSTGEGLARTFRSSLTADLSISSASDDPFTLFGSELPLLGEFFKMPTILEYDQVLGKVKATLPDAQVEPLVVGAAKISLGSFSSSAPFFAVDLNSYLQFFSSLEIVWGEPPPRGVASLFLNDRMAQRAQEALGRPLKKGDVFLLTAAQDNSFALREVSLAGVFRYPVYDPLLENVFLIDVGTGRALAGYFITQAQSQEEAPSVVSGSIDDLFADAVDTKADRREEISFEKVSRELAQATTQPIADPRTWNFLLVHSNHPEADAALLSSALSTTSAPVQVRDWRDTAGGNAKLVWFIQMLFNVGLVFITLVAGLIVMNSMSLAVAERTREIGTMRSLGAQKKWVGALVSWETLILVAGSGSVGVLLGGAVLVVLALLGGITIDNPFLATLLGTSQYIPSLSWVLVLEHVVLSGLVGGIATILPVKRALTVTPLQAMARE